MKINDFYKAILSVGSLVANDAGVVQAKTEAGSIPFTVSGKALVLPTAQHLADPDKKEIVLFHPLSENILRNESDVMARYRSAVNLRLNYGIGHMLEELIVLATSPGMHSQLSPSHYELMALWKDADEKTLKDYGAILKAMPPGNIEKCFVHFYMKKNAMVSGKSHRRGVIVTWPLYEELLKNKDGAFGAKLRKKDHASLVAALELLFPKIGEAGAYDRGSISDTAPTLDALLLGVLGVAGNVNAIVDDYCTVLPKLSALRYDDEWVSVLDNLNQFTNELRLLPMQAGNEGAVPGATPAPQLQNTVGLPVPQNNQLVMPAPYQPPVYQPQVQQQPNGPALAPDGLLDFSAAMRGDPRMAQMGGYGYMPPPPPPGPSTSRMGAPRWDTPTYGQGQWGAPALALPNNNYGNIRI